MNKEPTRLQSPGGNTPTYPYLCFMSLVATKPKKQLPQVVDGSEHLEGFATFANQTLTGLTYIGRYGYKSFYYDNSLVL
jgi:hypothetical protein